MGGVDVLGGNGPAAARSGRSKQSQASGTRIMSQPMLAPVRTVVETHMSVEMPKATTWLRAEALQAKVEVGADEGRVDALRDQRLVAMRAEAGAKAIAGVPGVSVEPGSIESWRTWMIGRPAARQAASSARPLASIWRFQRRRPGRIVEASLHVDRKEDGAVEIEGHDRQLTRRGPLPAHKKTNGGHKGNLAQRPACSLCGAAAKSRRPEAQQEY